MTRREELIEFLSSESFNIKEMAEIFDVSIKTIEIDLEHVRKSLKRVNKRLLVKPAKCMACEYIFTKMNKIKDPKKCPNCHSERIHSRFYKIEDN